MILASKLQAAEAAVKEEVSKYLGAGDELTLPSRTAYDPQLQAQNPERLALHKSMTEAKAHAGHKAQQHGTLAP